jgi:hypothetical protein
MSSESLEDTYCEFESCDEIANVRIQEVRICTKHIKWAMDLAFKPVKEALSKVT